MSKLRALVEAVGGEWSTVLEGLWTKATSDIRAPRGAVTVGQVLDGVNAVLGDLRDQIYSHDFKEAAKAQLRSGESPWVAVKEHGISAFKGTAYTSVVELLDQLDALGVVLVRDGELERLAPAVPVRKGPAWLPAALRANEQGNERTQAHVKRIRDVGVAKVAV